MGCAALSRWLKGSTQGMFQEWDLDVCWRKVEVTAFSSIYWNVKPLDTYTETTSKVSTHSSLHRLWNNGCHCCHHPVMKIHSNILHHVNGNCCHLLFLDSTRKTCTRRATWNLIYMALWFPEFLQSILHLQ